MIRNRSILPLSRARVQVRATFVFYLAGLKLGWYKVLADVIAIHKESFLTIFFFLPKEEKCHSYSNTLISGEYERQLKESEDERRVKGRVDGIKET